MLALVLAVLQPLACHLIQADWITGRDLASAVPALSKIDPDARLGLAPFPGQQRTFHIAELKRLAVAYQASAEIESPVCFSWNVKPPARQEMAAAMRRTLGDRAVSIEIAESSLIPAPPGEVVFPLSGFSASFDKPGLWRGYVKYAGDKRFPVWATATITVREQHITPLMDMKYGDAISLDQLKSQTYVGPLRREKFLFDSQAIIGFRCTRLIHAGTELTAEMLEAPREVNQGDTVDAIVETGAAKIDLKGIAERDGRKGQIIPVRNPGSGRVFHARVEDKGLVVVVPGGSYGLVVVEAKKS